jgi:peptidoglycan-associated lipoprotein
MKTIRFTSLFALALVLTLASSGCKTHKPPVTQLPLRTPGFAGGEPGPGSGVALPSGPGSGDVTGSLATGIASNPQGSHDGWTPNAEVLQADMVHFAYDSSVVRDSERPKVAAVADYLKSNTGDAVRVEGHCDERGTEEYNRALGERRALAVREELVRLGIEPGRVDTISYGKDRPLNPGHDEAAWRQNRRAEFIVLMPPR